MKKIFGLTTIQSKLFIFIILNVIFLISMLLIVDKYFKQENNMLTSEYYFKSKTKECAAKVSKIFGKNFVQCYTIANQLSDMYNKINPLVITEIDIDRFAEKILEKNTTISGVKIVLEPTNPVSKAKRDSIRANSNNFEFDVYSLRLKHLEPPKSYYWFAYDLNGNRNNQRVNIENIENGILYKTISADPKTIILPPENYKIQDQKIRLITIAVPILSRNKFCGFIAMDIEVGIFYKLLDDIKDFNTESSFTLLSHNNIIVSSTQKNYLSGQDANKLFRNETLNDMTKEGVFTYKFLNETTINTTAVINFDYDVPAWKLHFQTHGGVSWLNFNKHGRLYYLLISILIFIFLAITGLLLNYYFSYWYKLKEQAQILASGQSLKHNIQFTIGEEINDIFNILQSVDGNIKRMKDFAEDLRKSKLTTEFAPLSKHDALGNSLLKLRTNLSMAKDEEKKYKQENEIRFWKSKGVTSFADIIRKNNSDIKVLSYKIISALVEYLKINQGGLFVIDSDNKDTVLELQGAFAYNRQKHHKKSIKLGEGLVGACALEKKTILLDKIPEDYIEITSGLGKTIPKLILLVPLISEQKMMGVIELASMNDFMQHEIDFIEEIAEMIASSINNVKINQKTNLLLERSELQSYKLSKQEEELRQTIEELQATKEEIDRKETQIEQNISFYEQLLDASPYLLSVTDDEDKWLFINKRLSSYLDLNKNTAIGQLSNRFGKGLFKNREISGNDRDYKLQIKHKGKDFNIYGYIINDIYGNKAGSVEFIIDETEPIQLKKENLELVSNLNLNMKIINQSAIYAELDPLENIIHTNNLFNNIIQYTPEEVIGNKINIILPPIDLKTFDKIWHTVSRGEIYQGEIKIMTKQGGDKWLYVTFLPIRNKQGVLLKVVLVAFDNSEKRNIELKYQRQLEKLTLKENELESTTLKLDMKEKELRSQINNYKRETKMLNALLDSIPYRIVFKDRNHIIQKANLAAVEYYNLKSISEIIGKSDFNFFTKGIADKHHEKEKQIILSNNSIFDFQEKLKKKDGSLHWFSHDLVPFTDNDNIVMGCFVNSKEITEEKRLLFENTRMNKDIDLLLKQFYAFTYIADSDWYVLEAKGKGEKLFELFGKAFVGRRLNEYPEIRNKLPEEAVMHTLNEITFEWVLKNEDEEIKFLHKLIRNELIPNEWYGIAVQI